MNYIYIYIYIYIVIIIIYIYIYSNNNNKLRILHFFVVVAEYGVTATDSAVCLIERSTFQRCRIFGARFLREANGTLLDCALQQSTLHGAKIMRSKPANQV
jgi:hypothetical protein